MTVRRNGIFLSDGTSVFAVDDDDNVNIHITQRSFITSDWGYVPPESVSFALTPGDLRNLRALQAKCKKHFRKRRDSGNGDGPLIGFTIPPSMIEGPL